MSPARTWASKLELTVPFMIGLALDLPLESRRTESRQSLTRAGLRFYASTFIWRPNSNQNRRLDLVKLQK
jgi:hypothetical protein